MGRNEIKDHELNDLSNDLKVVSLVVIALSYKVVFMDKTQINRMQYSYTKVIIG